MIRLLGILMGVFLSLYLEAQEESLVSFLQEGEVSGQIRNYFMTTYNKEGKDYFGDAIGGLFRYESKSYKGFQLGVSGSVTYKVFSSDLNEADRQTGKTAKWERELFDVNRPDNYKDLFRLEELFIVYKWKESQIKYGKIPVLLTPLLNKSDGRMNPFLFQGGWLHHSLKEDGWNMDASWIHKVSPRSMMEWYSLAESFGLNSNGQQPNGELADYQNWTPVKGVGVMHLGNRTEKWDVDFWHFYIDKVLNTSWFEFKYKLLRWQFGGIWSYQIPHRYQEKLSYKHRYVQPHENGHVLSVEGKRTIKNSSIKMSYSRAFKSGRYLFPRELGRDQFYTSISRSRLEGLGNVHFVSVGYRYQWKGLVLHLDGVSSFGISAKEKTFNKYGLDDFYQLNTRIHYSFSKFLNVLNIEILYVWKENKNIHRPDFAYQKSDYNQINFVTNFKF